MFAIPERSVVDYAASANALGALVRRLRTETGPITFSDINLVFQFRAQIELAFDAVQADAQTAGNLVRRQIEDRGGPATLGAFQTAHNDVITALQQTQQPFLALARSATKAQLINVVERQFAEGVTIRQIELAQATPQIAADALRTGPELLALENAITALGA